MFGSHQTFVKSSRYPSSFSTHRPSNERTERSLSSVSSSRSISHFDHVPCLLQPGASDVVLEALLDHQLPFETPHHLSSQSNLASVDSLQYSPTLSAATAIACDSPEYHLALLKDLEPNELESNPRWSFYRLCCYPISTEGNSINCFLCTWFLSQCFFFLVTTQLARLLSFFDFWVSLTVILRASLISPAWQIDRNSVIGLLALSICRISIVNICFYFRRSAGVWIEISMAFVCISSLVVAGVKLVYQIDTVVLSFIYLQCALIVAEWWAMWTSDCRRRKRALWSRERKLLAATAQGREIPLLKRLCSSSQCPTILGRDIVPDLDIYGSCDHAKNDKNEWNNRACRSSENIISSSASYKDCNSFTIPIVQDAQTTTSRPLHNLPVYPDTPMRLSYFPDGQKILGWADGSSTVPSDARFIRIGNVRISII